MEWYQYLAAFFAGAFLTNAVPHFVHGISGNQFPTPFSKPSGIGLSSPTTNTVWALFNLVIGYLLCTVAQLDNAHPLLLTVFFAGMSAMGIFSSIRFKSKHKE